MKEKIKIVKFQSVISFLAIAQRKSHTIFCSEANFPRSLTINSLVFLRINLHGKGRLKINGLYTCLFGRGVVLLYFTVHSPPHPHTQTYTQTLPPTNTKSARLFPQLKVPVSKRRWKPSTFSGCHFRRASSVNKSLLICILGDLYGHEYTKIAAQGGDLMKIEYKTDFHHWRVP